VQVIGRAVPDAAHLPLVLQVQNRRLGTHAGPAPDVVRAACRGRRPGYAGSVLRTRWKAVVGFLASTAALAASCVLMVARNQVGHEHADQQAAGHLAPGYQGCRYSGVAFTSERLLLEGRIPRIPAPTGRLSTRPLPFSEPSATVVWRTLRELGMEDETVLWNALQMHPHHPKEPWSNRSPARAELALGTPALKLLRRAFPNATFVPVGKKAEAILRDAD